VEYEEIPPLQLVFCDHDMAVVASRRVVALVQDATAGKGVHSGAHRPSKIYAYVQVSAAAKEGGGVQPGAQLVVLSDAPRTWRNLGIGAGEVQKFCPRR
jgi:hypothetical protein